MLRALSLFIHSRRILAFLAAILALVFCRDSSAQSVILHLKNGDRLSGFITSETTNRIVLTNLWSREIVVPAEAILRREPLASGSGKTPIPAVPGSGANTNAIAVKPKSEMKWSGEVQLGVDLGFSEKNRELYTGRTKIAMSYHRLRNVFDSNFAYGRTEGITSANRVDGFAKTDYDLTRREYVYNLAGAGYDEIRKINFRYEIGPGLGHHVIKWTNFVLKAELGFNYQAQYLADDTKSELFYHRFAEDSAWKINDKFSIDQKFEFFPRVGYWGDYRFRFESNLRYALLNNVFLNLTVLDQYDTDPAEGVGQNDLQVRSTIGVKF